jgi:uncharacterized membrane protein (UPF0127 family)
MTEGAALAAGEATFGSAHNVTRGVAVATRLEAARSLWAKFMGLMGRPTLPPGDGLWLPGTNGIHMMFMRFPIDVVFVGRRGPEGRPVLAVRRRLRTWIGVVPLVRGADGVLELPIGTLDATGTVVGDMIRLDGVE